MSGTPNRPNRNGEGGQELGLEESTTAGLVETMPSIILLAFSGNRQYSLTLRLSDGEELGSVRSMG
jgi:DNA-binding IclR family transcriptional regulator